MSKSRIRKNEQEISHAAQTPSSLYIHREDGEVSRKKREELFGYRAVTVWCTGLSGSGKSTVAKALEARLFAAGRPVYRLDGDNLRYGLNKNLGFSQEDRQENIRRVAEVARLFNDAGVSVICSLISPMRIDRQRAREIIGDTSFIEVYLSTPRSECEKRDPHGLYKKARAGEITNFTGVSAPYEAPEQPQVDLDTTKCSVAQSVERILESIARKATREGYSAQDF